MVNLHKALLTQSIFIQSPKITEKNCPDQTGRVFIVTGGYAGIGFELSKILYSHNAVLYIAGRSEDKATAAIARIKVDVKETKGRLEFLHLDLSDLKTIKPGVDDFLSKEQRLDVLVNNAAVLCPPVGSKDAQGNDLQIGTNCVGPYLLYNLLEPILIKTAASSPEGSVRVAWAASLAVDTGSPRPHGMDLDDEGRPKDLGGLVNYAQSKVGNVFIAKVLAKKTALTRVVHTAFNPGNVSSELGRNFNPIALWFAGFLIHPAIYGAYTELWAAVSPDLTIEDSGAYVVPWGRTEGFRHDIEDASRDSSEGGTGVASKFVAWCQQQTGLAET